jgi:acetylornithine/N-succinyldiaminopimelate aminotransferase
MSRQSPHSIKYDDMGTTFGGGPMACAAAEAVIEAIESESLLANVRQVSAYIRSNCIVGPVTGVAGRGFSARPEDLAPAKEVHAALLECGILTGTSADPNVLRLLPAYILNEGHVDQLCDALAKIPA